MHLEVLLSPSDFPALKQRDLSQTLCVVFDVLRATTTMVTALANGADAILPVTTLEQALEEKRKNPNILLAGERNGLKIDAQQTGSIPFDFGNSPREFVPQRVQGRRIVATTTNGTRALEACRQAQRLMACSFANLSATAAGMLANPASHALILCSGTGEQTALEDILGAGALAEMLLRSPGVTSNDDATTLARQAYRQASSRLAEALGESRNGRRLLTLPDLREDVALCAKIDSHPLLAVMDIDGWMVKR